MGGCGEIRLVLGVLRRTGSESEAVEPCWRYWGAELLLDLEMM
jgi:hypothetical protein